MTHAATRTVTTTLRDWLLLLRPQQWVKNGFVLAPLLFSGRMLQPDAIRQALEACVSFCLVASAVYVFNDVMDRERDCAHPVKRARPVASGRISIAAALPVSLVLGVVGLGLGWLVHPTVGAILGSYLGLNLLYTLRLKQVVLLDVFSIATFFVLRLLAGAEAIQVVPSIWLILCGGLLALYLGFAKRRHELMLLGGASASHRGVLAEYSPQFLDQMSTVLLSVTLISYVMYTLSPEKLAEVGSYALTYSTGFVLYGVFRYLYLVHQKEQGSPTEAVLTDRSLLTAVVLWAGYCALVIYRAV